MGGAGAACVACTVHRCPAHPTPGTRRQAQRMLRAISQAPSLRLRHPLPHHHYHKHTQVWGLLQLLALGPLGSLATLPWGSSPLMHSIQVRLILNRTNNSPLVAFVVNIRIDMTFTSVICWKF